MRRASDDVPDLKQTHGHFQSTLYNLIGIGITTDFTGEYDEDKYTHKYDNSIDETKGVACC